MTKPPVPAVLTIGLRTHVQGWTDVGFEDATSTHDFDVVIWEPNSIRSAQDMAAVRYAAQRRHNEFSTFLGLGGTIIVFGEVEERFHVYDDFASHGGSQVIGGWDAFPEMPPEMEPVSGKKVQVLGDSKPARFIREHVHLIRYAASIRNVADIEPLATAGNTSDVVAAVMTFDSGGRLVVLPQMDRAFINPKATTLDRVAGSAAAIDVEASAEFYTSLVAACVPSIETIDVPEWAEASFTANEDEARRLLQVASNQLVAAEAEVAQATRALEPFAADKVLLYGTGDALADQCSEVLERLGCVKLSVPVNRTDLRFDVDGTRLVVEVKGLTKSAKESNAAQLEKWVAEEVIEGTPSASIKPLLLVNAYRTDPPELREKAFPDQMVGFSTHRNHALVTTTQLFQLAVEVSEGRLTAGAAVQRLISCVGVLEQ
ncbi:hypothetical protein ACEXQD_18310 [Herbiconiux sp. P15]|uniref:hypothetical protein n=1 Tax=Herbiconiux liukaitaii TaxID=3342799 RepID=UPI0035B7A5EF